MTAFHYAFLVADLASTRRFYGELLGCREGRSTTSWVDFDFFGHQIVAHLDREMVPRPTHNSVDGHDVPVPHFGAVLDMATWENLAERLRSEGTEFVIEPGVRFRGRPGEQATMFFLDPSGNALEFKAFADRSQVFAK